ncbi:sigma 54-interacting transcriptional regulator [Bacillaceae bacterium Marseille-Q3522]|nr:sigma 54-interacting transcriptional regulator [Bacillaceae bacterium Marseille-Q3522]
MENEKILIIDDEETIRLLLAALLKREGYEVETACDGEDGLEKINRFHPTLVIMDIRMPKMDGISLLKKIRSDKNPPVVIMMTAFVSVDTTVNAIKLGAFEYLIKPFNNDEILLLVKKVLQMRQLTNEVEKLQNKLPNHYRKKKFLTNNLDMMNLLKQIGKVALTNATVLITGESGTGKELIANMIHFNSNRKEAPYIKINCSSLPEALLESELFGHEKGAFTGAISRKLGRFELAHKGTIFLDEIGEISPNLQVKLLRVLQEREFERVGGTETIHVDIRIIAATNRNLKKIVKTGEFREDLFYRLNVVSIKVPPLRNRKEDISLIAQHYLHKFSLENDKKIFGFSPETMAILESYPWPGNIRELENVIESAIIMSVGSVIFTEDLPPEITHYRETKAAKKQETGPQTNQEAEIVTINFPQVNTNGLTLKEIVKDYEKTIIKQALLMYDGNKVKTAKELGMSRRSLQYKIHEYELEE